MNEYNIQYKWETCSHIADIGQNGQMTQNTIKHQQNKMLLLYWPRLTLLKTIGPINKRADIKYIQH